MNDKLSSFKEKLINRYFEPVEEEEVVVENTKVQSETAININDSDIIEPIIEKTVEKSYAVKEPKKEKTIETSIFEEELINTPIVRKLSKISKSTEIQGSINADSDLEINGKVIGDITTTGHITVKGGTVIGNIKSLSLILIDSTIDGNIECDLSLNIHQNSITTGYIKAKSATLSHKCEGNIYVENTLTLSSVAVIHGDIQSGKIKIDEGAILDGQVLIKPHND